MVIFRKEANLEIPEELHGTVFNDGFFGYGFTWSADERYVAFCAEVCFLPIGMHFESL